MKRAWDELLVALLLVRIGQELGQAGPLAAAVRDFLDCLIRVGR